MCPVDHAPSWLRSRAPVPCLIALLALPGIARAEERPRYLLGEEGQGIEMIVHIMGEVQKPGEYRVSDHTNVLELLSKAGGPTAFSRLSGVTVRRAGAGAEGAGDGDSAAGILHVDLQRFLKQEGAPSPPSLNPGDVVLVPRNALHKWKDISAIVRDISVVASVYLLYVRVSKD